MKGESELDRHEEEFKALTRVASFSFNTMLQIWDTIEKSLREHPEWKKHLVIGEILCQE